MTKRSHFSVLDPIIRPQARSELFQKLLHAGRRLDWTNPKYFQFDSPILLLGSARGGTTLLSNIVGSHPKVYLFHERFTRGKQSYDDTFGSSHNPLAFKRSFLQFIPHYVKKSRMRWGVKIITHIWEREDYDRFLGAFPQLQIVFVVRDGRDTVLSILKRSAHIRTSEEAFERWIESVKIFDYLKSNAHDRFFWYYYEDFVREPETVLHKICEFLRLSYNPSMLDYHNWPGLGSYEIAPITAEKVNKWQQQPLPDVSPEIASRFDQALRSMGYAKNGPPRKSASELTQEKS